MQALFGWLLVLAGGFGLIGALFNLTHLKDDKGKPIFTFKDTKERIWSGAAGIIMVVIGLMMQPGDGDKPKGQANVQVSPSNEEITPPVTDAIAAKYPHLAADKLNRLADKNNDANLDGVDWVDMSVEERKSVLPLLITRMEMSKILQKQGRLVNLDNEPKFIEMVFSKTVKLHEFMDSYYKDKANRSKPMLVYIADWLPLLIDTVPSEDE